MDDGESAFAEFKKIWYTMLVILLIMFAVVACHILRRTFCDDATEPMRRETRNEAAESEIPTERSSLSSSRNPNLDPPPAYNTLIGGNEAQRPPPYSKRK